MNAPRDDDYIEPWEAPNMPGRAGTGLLGCIVVLLIPSLLIAGAAIWLIGGAIGWIVAGVIAFFYLLFLGGAIWQIREMGQAGGYTRIRPPPGL
jgi:hypothetical protein